MENNRCEANGIFVRSLKEHDDAIKVVKLLKEDLAPFTSQPELIDLTQVNSVTDKLKAYSHLFNAQAIKEFAQLGQENVDPETAQWDTRADDNKRGQIDVAEAKVGTEERNLTGNLGDRLIEMLNKLEEHLKKSIEDLTQKEIRAAWDLAQWLQDSEAELEHLEKEEKRKLAYQDKLSIAINEAKAKEDQAWEIYFESATTLNNAIDKCKA